MILPPSRRARRALAFYDGMEKAIAGKEWLAGSYSYADIAFYMAQIFGDRMGAPMADAHPKLQAWRDRMSARPAVRQVASAMGRYLLSQGRKLPAFLAKQLTTFHLAPGGAAAARLEVGTSLAATRRRASRSAPG